MAYWVYKCNTTGKNGPASGEWRDVFNESGPVPWGPVDIIPALAQLQKGHILLAYQTDRNELVGIARVTGFTKPLNAKRVIVEALELIGAKVRPLKTANPAIAAIKALQGGEIKTIYDISEMDAIRLVQAARKQIGVDPRPDADPMFNSQEREEPLRDLLETAHLSGRGFQTDPEIRKAVERYAVERARSHYEKLGYGVVEHGKPFDLKCTKQKTTLYVEVKGIQGTDTEIILTPNEVEFARQKKMELFVVHSVKISHRLSRCRVSGGIERVINPWRPRSEDLKPIAYWYSLK